MTRIPFNISRGAAASLQMSPPFAFSDVTMSVFPLRASLPTLDAFCRNYLNQAGHMVQFRPFVPFVYLVILDYGRMSLEAANMGWVSQREVAFGIPLLWLTRQGDALKFHDWAFTSPFIFVDNELSMSTGREVYGWPKLLARLDPSVSEWVRDPHGPRRVFQVSTQRANRAFEGETQEYRSFLSVYQHRTAGLLDVPPNLDALVKPLSQLSEAVTGMTRLGADLARTFTGLASDGITGSSVLPDMMDMKTLRQQLTPERLSQWRDPKSWAPGMKDLLWSMFPRNYANTINFKQFRDAGDPYATCYQAITSARMPVTNMKGGGFLGPQNMLLGQLDGGFRIDVHHLAGLPIVQSLGLEVTEERETGGARVSSLSPVSPFWMQVDMTYGLADTLVWRGRSGAWQEGDALARIRAEAAAKQKPPQQATTQTDSADSAQADSARADTAQAESTQADSANPAPDAGTPASPAPISRATSFPFKQTKPLRDEDLEDTLRLDYIQAMNFFNTARGSSEAIGGAFYMPNASVRVLPLKADPDALQKFARSYLRVQGHMRFEAWGDFVYLVICDFDQVTSEINAMAKRRAREVNLMVPVKAYNWFDERDFAGRHRPDTQKEDADKHVERGKQHLVTTGVVSAFSFVDDAATAITASEVSGIPSMGSRIISPANDWITFDPSKKEAHHDLLTTSAQVLPALMVGAEARERNLIRLHTHAPTQRDVPETQRESVSRWVRLLADDIETKLSESKTRAPDGEQLEGEDQVPAFNVAQGLALQLLGGERPVNQFSLKQFRDSRFTDSACYQGLIVRQHRIDKLRDMREMEDPIHISITDFPTQPITEVLGLVAKFTYPGKDRLVKVFEAIRPFSLQADLHRGSGATLYERVGSATWTKVDTQTQIFGWRDAARGEALDLVDRARADPDMAQIELCYCFKQTRHSAALLVRSGKVGAAYITGEFAQQLETGDISDLKIKDRRSADGVRMVIDEDLLKRLTSEGMLDISAWITEMHMAGKEARFPQHRAAGAMERISPATVLDSVLSRQWGHAPGSERRDYDKPDFCVPRRTVPTPYARRLFPDSELLHSFWPHTFEFKTYRESRRRSENLGLKSDIWASVGVYARLFMRQLMMYSSGWHKNDDISTDKFVDGEIKRLRLLLDKDERAALKGFRRKRRGQGIEAMEDLADFITAMANELAPRDFKDIQPQEDEGPADSNPLSVSRPVVSSQQLADLIAALQRLNTLFCAQCDTGGKQLVEVVDDMWTTLIKRAKVNHEKTLEFEDSQLDTPHSSEVITPQTVLRARLAKLMTGGVLPDEDTA